MAKEQAGKKAEDVVFGKQAPTPTGIVEEKGVSGRKIEVDEESMKKLLETVAALQADKERRVQAEDDIFNPLKEIKTDHTIRISFYNDKLVKGYVGKERPDGSVVYVTNRVIEDGEFKGQMRGMVTLEYVDGTTEIVDHVRFLTELTPISVPIKKRTDIGKVIEQGEVTRLTWNGRALIPTSTRVMTGCKEQRFEFLVDYKGTEYTLMQDVINLK